MPALILIVPLIAAYFGERPVTRPPHLTAYVLDVRLEPAAFENVPLAAIAQGGAYGR